MNVQTVKELNELIRSDRTAEYIESEENRIHDEIKEIAAQITAKNHELKWVWLAGPSSAGKTTFTNRLAAELKRQGVKTRPISLDNYFVDRKFTPKDAKGNYDYEHIEAIDLTLLERHLDDLGSGKTVEMPHFRFRHGKREFRGELLHIKPDELALIEGIHGLNPRITAFVNPIHSFRIYIGARTTLKLDTDTRISTTDHRLMRRMLRDYSFRGHSAQTTFELWPSVRAGEDKWIFPYQPLADREFNTAMGYEISVLKPLVEPLIHSLPQSHPGQVKARELLEFLSHFESIDKSFVPPHSILQEFIESPK
jgi:uridine kinase